MEQWRDIEGYEGLYQISNQGRVRSLDRIVAHRWSGYQSFKGKIIKEYSRNGYRRVGLHKDGKPTYYLVHRLVAQAFIPNPEEKEEVDHIDTNPSNNRVENLRWATSLENNRNPLTCKNRSDALKGDNNPMYGKLGKDNPTSKGIYQISKDGNLIGKWEGMREAERYTGVNQSNIVKCCKGKQKAAKGYRWIYASDLDAFLIEKMLKNIQKKRTA